jgi:hypothetical protein
MIVSQDDFAAFDLLEQIVFRSIAADQIGVIDALRRPMTFSTARQRQEFIAFDEDDQVFHLRADQVAQIGPIAPGDQITDATGDQYDVLVNELQSGGTRWHVVARQRPLPAPDPEPGADSGPVLWLKMDDLLGEIIVDSAGNETPSRGGDLILPGSSVADGAVARALHFSGIIGGGGPRIVLANVPEVRQLAPLTIALWLRLEDLLDHTLLDFGKMKLFLDAGRPALRQDFTTTDGLWRCDNALTTGEWIHLAVIYQREASDETPNFYVDGDLVAKTEVTAPVGSIDTDAASQKMIGNDLTLGEPMAGDLDDLRLYERIINETEIGALATLAAIQPV